METNEAQDSDGLDHTVQSESPDSEPLPDDKPGQSTLDPPEGKEEEGHNLNIIPLSSPLDSIAPIIEATAGQGGPDFVARKKQVIKNLDDYFDQLESDLLEKEGLMLDWVEYKLDEAYYRLWNDFAVKNFRKIIINRMRRKTLKKSIK